MHVTEKLVTSGKARLATEAWGTPDRGTILMAMGATASMVWWPDALMRGLADGGYQVIRFDHRDTGRSTTHEPGDVRYDVRDLADDLLAILDAYDVAAAHVVGMSLGGYLAQIDALLHPERVLTLTLIASEPVGLSYAGEGIAPDLMAHFGTMGELDWADRDAVGAFLLRIAELSAGSGPFDSADAQRRIARELERTTSMQSAFNHAAMAGELGADLSAANIRQPLLLIHGSEDPVISATASEAFEVAVPSARSLVLDGVGHELPVSEIPQITAAILEHCATAG